MDQTFIEILVERKRNTAEGILKIIGGILAVLFLLTVPLSFVFIFAAAAFGALAYYGYLQERVEYEYSYVCKELTVDKIMARSRRRTEASYLLEKVEIGAPEGSYHLDGYQNRNYAVKDYSSQKGGKTFVLYYEGSVKVILEENEELIQALRSTAPNKIFLN